MDFARLKNRFQDQSDLIYSPVREGQAWYDKNEDNRAIVLTGYQYLREDDDESTLRFLLEQEILRAENDPFQGMGEPLHLCAYLLSRFRRPEDVILFCRAKTANFDARCAFDAEHLYLVPAEDVKALRPSFTERTWNLYCEFDYDQEDIAYWLEAKAEYYPEDWTKESPSIQSEIVNLFESF